MSPEHLHQIADDIEARRAALPAISGPDYSASHARHRAACAVLAEHLRHDYGARIAEVNASGWRVRIAGLTATSTGGCAAALGNWVQAARRKAGVA